MHVGHLRPDPSDTAGETWRLRGRQRRSALTESALDWHRHGLDPHWTGMETSACVAALEPNLFPSGGGDELHRFLEGARSRGETALAVIPLGDGADDTPRSVLMRDGASFFLPGFDGMLVGRRLPTGTRPRLASDLDPAEKDLGLRLRNRPAEAPWWELKAVGLTLEPGAGGPVTRRKPQGELRPILVDGLGQPVAGVWVTPDGHQRWYVIPDATDWDSVLDWLVHKALPAYVPGALRRVRSPHFDDPDLHTAAETAARQALEAEEARHAAEKARLQDVLDQARATAGPIREGLLYGTGQELEDAVDAVLQAAGFTTVRLDAELNGTHSADILALLGPHRLLVEVKSASGEAGEKLVGAAEKHLATWPALRPQDPVTGAVLIVNDQHKTAVTERKPQVYRRQEFVASLPFPVLSTRALFGWWRTEDWMALQKAMLDTALPPTAAPTAVPSSALRSGRRHQTQSSCE